MDKDISLPVKSNHIAVLITCHNRKAKTLACLNALFKNTLPNEYLLFVFLVDDGSADGTEQAVIEQFPQVTIIKGDGNLFWSGGMRVAFEKAIERKFDYYLWLNDDTLLFTNALQSLIATSIRLSSKQEQSVIIVGSTKDEITGKLTYGGLTRLKKWKRTTFSSIIPSEVPLECETMNGNCVLIPKDVVKKIGGMDPEFSHSMGDLDYGLRACYAGFSVWIMPNYAGTCSNNVVTGSFQDESLSVRERLRKMINPKGVPLASWRIFTQRHAGFLWPFFWLWPYAKVIVKSLLRK